MSLSDRGDAWVLKGKSDSCAANLNDASGFGNAAIGGRIKRSLDVFLALWGLFLFSPLFLFVAVAVKISSTGPVLYGHTRVGFRGRSFKCWKFRTMVLDGDQVLEHHFALTPTAREEWLASRKLKNDPRVTQIGRILREFSLDELPQLLNVLRGDMSFVGPRPVVAEELKLYGESIGHYLAARPGLTGLWQVSGRSETTYSTRVSLDTNYVEHWSLARDCAIMLRTIPAVMTANGSC